MKKVNRRMLLVAVLLVLGASAATFAQKASRDSVVCLNRYWLCSIRGGYDFNPNTRGANRFLDEKGGFNLGFGFDHYWKWFGVTKMTDTKVRTKVPDGVGKKMLILSIAYS